MIKSKWLIAIKKQKQWLIQSRSLLDTFVRGMRALRILLLLVVFIELGQTQQSQYLLVRLDSKPEIGLTEQEKGVRSGKGEQKFFRFPSWIMQFFYFYL
jgi:hypothetical protein